MTPGRQDARSPERIFTIEPSPSVKPSVLRKKRSEIVSTHDREVHVLVKRSRGTQRRLPVLRGRLRAWPSRAFSCLLELVVYRFMYLQVSTQTCIAGHNCDCPSSIFDFMIVPRVNKVERFRKICKQTFRRFYHFIPSVIENLYS